MPPQTETVLARLIERVEGRYYGKYRGIVSDNNDPNNLGRVKASVPRLLGDSVTTGWALPAFAYGGAKEQGFFAVADIGAGVWIEFEGGDLRFPIWSGTWYTTDAIPESAKPGKKVLKTKSGHKIVLDDDANSLTIADSNGNTVTHGSGYGDRHGRKGFESSGECAENRTGRIVSPRRARRPGNSIPDATGAGVQRSYAPRRIGGGNVSGQPDGARTFTGPSAFRNFLEEGNLGMIAARKDEI